MKRFLGSLLLTSILGLGLCGFSDVAEAKTHHKIRHVAHHKSSKAKAHKTSHKKVHKGSHKASALDSSVRTAQMQLSDLGYYAGNIDGKNGSMTKHAIMAFQRDHRLPADGKLTAETKSLLAKFAYDVRGLGIRNPEPTRTLGDVRPVPAPSIAAALAINSRYGQFEIQEDLLETNERNYHVTLNGQTVLDASNQPSRLRVSEVYPIADGDAVLFAVYSGKTDCPFRNYLLVVQPNGATNGLREIPECSDKGVAHELNGMLVINFPNGYDETTPGTGWRYEGGNLNPML